jgi:hypothetical protein
MLSARQETGIPLTRNLVHALDEMGNWEIINKKIYAFKPGKPLARNLIYTLGETGNWKPIDKKLNLCFRRHGKLETH